MPENAQEIVREKFSQAVARHQKADDQHGQSAPICPERWVVFAGRGLGDRELGEGTTEHQAWVNASSAVLSDLRKPTGIEITREKLNDAGIVGGGPAVEEMLQDLEGQGLEIKVTEQS